MNALAQFPPPIEIALDPVILRAALDACSRGLAVSEKDCIIVANLAFARPLGFDHSSDVIGVSLPTLFPEWSTNQTDVLARNGTRLRISKTTLAIPNRDLHVLTTGEIPGIEPSPSPTNMEALGRLVGGVAHDFNNLLTGILLYCDLMQPIVKGDAKLTRYVDEMRGAGEQAATLIQQLMEVARKQATEPVMLSWNEAIQNLRNLLRRLIGENIQLVCDLDHDLGMVRMRPAQMPQVILNLALNARDAMPAGGMLTLSTRNVDGHIHFIVSDTGCGMDDTTQSRVLEPFFTTKPPGTGNGLGLSTVRRIAEEQRGVLKLESRLGQGTKVIVRLPRAAKDLIQKGTSL
ncbi:MAG TPA: ATP-binding protein [Terriglobales bacterium]|jgi:signal transduction histidine kinase|nr:ATP-binding protein [Terriglobales bacterium]